MKQYHQLVNKIMREGTVRSDRTGVGTRGIFGYQMRFDLREGFPAVTSKHLAFRSCAAELLWMIEGSGDERRLAEITHGTRDTARRTIWTENAQAQYWTPRAQFEGDLGRVYGVQWRNWRSVDEHGNVRHVDQLSELIRGLQSDPYGRRHIISAWNPGELNQMALPPCHVMAQFYVSDGRLSCQLYQRSADVFLGVPFNIASYALFTHMIAQVCDLQVGEFVHTLGDAHIYLNHERPVDIMMSRGPLPLPKLELNSDVNDIVDFSLNDIQLVDYYSHGPISAPMAV